LTSRRLDRSFYARSTLVVARDLLGKTLRHGALAGRIVEVEAYCGQTDLASHARSGPKGRAALMWGEPGHAYVYLIYGMHHCVNAVCEPEGQAGAALIRAIEAADGARGAGPALVCRALGIDRSCHGADLTTSELGIEDAPPLADEAVRMGPRVGVDYAGAWAAHPWRFWIADSPHVSRRTTQGQPYDPRLVLA